MLLACGETSADERRPDSRDPDGQVAGSPAGMGDAGGRPGNVGGQRSDAGAPPSHAGAPASDGSAIAALESCDVAEPCPTAYAQLIEGSTHNISPDSVCVLAALRDRKPGRYRLETNATNTATSDGTEHVILVHEGGQVTHAQASYRSSHSMPQSKVVGAAAERCELQPASYFEGCLAALSHESADAESPDAGWLCLFGSRGQLPQGPAWFDNCEADAKVSCEPPVE
jgi:hypothetical protein